MVRILPLLGLMLPEITLAPLVDQGCTPVCSHHDHLFYMNQNLWKTSGMIMLK